MENQETDDRQVASRIEMSRGWAPKERGKLIAVLDGEITELDVEEQKLRETIHYEAPCFREISVKRQRLSQLRTYAEGKPSSFLEANRRNYADYVV